MGEGGGCCIVAFGGVGWECCFGSGIDAFEGVAGVGVVEGGGVAVAAACLLAGTAALSNVPVARTASMILLGWGGVAVSCVILPGCGATAFGFTAVRAGAFFSATAFTTFSLAAVVFTVAFLAALCPRLSATAFFGRPRFFVAAGATGLVVAIVRSQWRVSRIEKVSRQSIYAVGGLGMRWADGFVCLESLGTRWWL